MNSEINGKEIRCREIGCRGIRCREIGCREIGCRGIDNGVTDWHMNGLTVKKKNDITKMIHIKIVQIMEENNDRFKRLWIYRLS